MIRSMLSKATFGAIKCATAATVLAASVAIGSMTTRGPGGGDDPVDPPAEPPGTGYLCGEDVSGLTSGPPGDTSSRPAPVRHVEATNVVE